MGCYTVPTAAAIIHYFMRKKNPSMRTKHHKWLNLLFLGGTIFGIVDHAINGELLAFSWRDLGLGVIITLTILVVWKIMAIADRTTAEDKATN